MKLINMINVKEQFGYNKYNTTVAIETSLHGVLECIKELFPSLYQEILSKNYDEDGNLVLENISYGELFSFDQPLKNFILKELVENKIFMDNDNLEDYYNPKNIKFKKNKNIGLLAICRFKTTTGMENNNDNISADFNLNKVFTYYDPYCTELNNTKLNFAINNLSDQLQSFLNKYTETNNLPYLSVYGNY